MKETLDFLLLVFAMLAIIALCDMNAIQSSENEPSLYNEAAP
jgi:hypothetical protein